MIAGNNGGTKNGNTWTGSVITTGLINYGFNEAAVKVFNDKFGVLSQPQAESEIKLQTEEELGKRVAAFMKKYNIESVEEVLKVFKDDKHKSPITMD